MNVTYGNPWNWPTPGSPSFLQWKFPFSKPISCSGRAPERPICQHWQWSRKNFLLSVYHTKQIHTLAVVRPFTKSSTKTKELLWILPLGDWTWSLSVICMNVIQFLSNFVMFCAFCVVLLHFNYEQFSFQRSHRKEKGGKKMVCMNEWKKKKTGYIFLISHTTHTTFPISPPPPPLWQESFVRGVHLEQLCHTCFHVLLDYRAAGPSFEAPPLPLSLCNALW